MQVCITCLILLAIAQKTGLIVAGFNLMHFRIVFAKALHNNILRYVTCSLRILMRLHSPKEVNKLSRELVGYLIRYIIYIQVLASL